MNISLSIANASNLASIGLSSIVLVLISINLFDVGNAY